MTLPNLKPTIYKLFFNETPKLPFLLHYKDTNKELSSAECLAMLKGIDADYQKGIFSTAMKKVLIDAIGDAAKRAKSKEAYTNPSSTIHLLTDEITAVKR